MEKLIIYGYTDENRQNGEKRFTADLNPEKVAYSISVNMTTSNKAPGSQTDTTNVQGLENEQMTFDLLLDDTGAAPSSGKVADRMHELLEVVYHIENEIHRPNYLKLSWGKTVDNFKCMLQSLRVEYTLFNAAGDPLRAKVNLTFVEHLDPATSRNGTSSPDMSHLFTIRAGDSLPQLCKNMYDDPYLYPIVAALNGMTHFRQLAMGSQLLLPPLEK